MTDLVLTYNDVLQAVRTSRCVTPKKRNPAKTRIGVYGETFQHAVARLADKLGAPFRVVMHLVRQLRVQHKLNYVGKRLVPTSDSDRSYVDKRLPVLPVVTHEVTDLIPAPTSDTYVDPELLRWPEYLEQRDVPSGDLFRQAIWGSGIVPTTPGTARWHKEREACMANHPAGNRMTSLVGVA